MKALPATFLVFTLALLAGCSFGSRQQLGSDKLALIKPGTTTRPEMIQWFGEPTSVGMDFAGKASAIWHHSRITSVPFYTDLKQQMLVAVFETNHVLLNFTLQDDIKATNGPTRPPAKSPKDR